MATRYVRSLMTPTAIVLLVGVQLYAARYSRLQRYSLEEISAGLGAALLIIGLTVSFDSSLVKRAFRTWVMRSIGRISYGMYLWMIPVLYVLPGYFPASRYSGWGFRVATLVIIIAIASASYFIIERPFLRLKARFEVVDAGEPVARRHAHSMSDQHQSEHVQPCEAPSGTGPDGYRPSPQGPSSLRTPWRS